MNLPDPETNPDDLTEFAAAKFAEIRAAIDRGDSAAVAGLTRDLAAEGSAELARFFTSGLVEIGTVKLARTTPLATERDERVRAAFLEEVEARPHAPRFPHPTWSRGRERRFLLLRAALFAAYVTEQAGQDPEMRQLFELGAEVAASDLLAWDTVHDSHLGELGAVDPRWSENTRGYVAQERLAAELPG